MIDGNERGPRIAGTARLARLTISRRRRVALAFRQCLLERHLLSVVTLTMVAHMHRFGNSRRLVRADVLKCERAGRHRRDAIATGPNGRSPWETVEVVGGSASSLVLQGRAAWLASATPAGVAWVYDTPVPGVSLRSPRALIAANPPGSVHAIPGPHAGGACDTRDRCRLAIKPRPSCLRDVPPGAMILVDAGRLESGICRCGSEIDR
jgi:hypothetical protein